MKKINREILGDILPVKEAFKVGSSAVVAEKMWSILSKKVGKTFVGSDYPTEFSTKKGSFIGYYATIASKTLVKINFLIGKNEQVYSIDIYGSDSTRADRTLYLMGFNIVRVIEQIVDVFTGDFDRYAESVENSKPRLKEAMTHFEIVAQWVNSDDRLIEDFLKRRKSIEQLFQEFSDLCHELGKKPPKSPGAIPWLLNKYVKEHSLPYRIPSIEVTSGLPETPINTDSEADEAFNELMENEHLLKFRILEFYARQVAAGNEKFKGVYVYGDGGNGKSFLAKSILEPLSNCFYMTGKLKGYTALASLLFKHREGEIIVLDDVVTGKDMKDEAISVILKAALDPEPPRRIQIGIAESSSYDSHSGKLFLTESEYKEYEDDIQAFTEENEVIDMTSGGIEDKNDFEFDSSVVFLTNYPKVPQAVQDRCWVIEMIFSNEEIMSIIETNVAKIVPNKVPEATELFNALGMGTPKPEDELEVINFMKSKASTSFGGRKFSIRVYKRLISLYLATRHTPMWKGFLSMELNNS